MDDLIYFIGKFIIGEKKSRWLHFVAKGNWDKIWNQLHRLDRDLNNRCRLYEKNGINVFLQTVSSMGIRRGTYVDRDGIKSICEELHQKDIADDSIYICGKHKIAFYFSHEGSLWVCSE